MAEFDRFTERARRVLDEMPGPRDERWRMTAWELEVFDGNHRAALDLVESSTVERWGRVPTALCACLDQNALGLAAEVAGGGRPPGDDVLRLLSERAEAEGDRLGAPDALRVAARLLGAREAVLFSRRDFAVRRLCTEEGKKLADTILRTDWTQWWFRDKSDWWVNGNRKQEEGKT